MTTYIITGLRTPTGRYGGALSRIRPDDLVAEVIRGVINETHIDPHTVDEVLIGNANGAGEDNRNVARMAWLAAGLPDTVPAMTINRLCASGMSAITTGTALIESGQAHRRIGGGIEQFDAVELNEAFAAQSLACIKEMGVDPQVVNQWGGAIALGHPLGSSGCRIVITLLNRLEKDQGTRGLATMCIGVGQGQSLAIERV